jgi:predicted Rossmann fold nucleotide-binding protein DprA/Smf involved in DNA uptake
MTSDENVLPKDLIILLCAVFGSHESKKGIRPLTALELHRLEQRLQCLDVTLTDLNDFDLEQFFLDWQDKSINFERVKALLNRSFSRGITLEQWAKAGIQVITKTCKSYPAAFKEKLGHRIPPLIYCVGNPDFFDNQIKVAIVGSRNAPDKDLEAAELVSRSLANNNFAVVSGGARGVDDTAMLNCLKSGGNAIGILADNLFRKSRNKEYKLFLREGRLTLISPFYPKAGFLAGHAMARNKLIYALSSHAIVMHSGLTGGTWQGSCENLKKGWAKTWVYRTADNDAGNCHLVNQGAQWLPENFSAVTQFPIEKNENDESMVKKLKNATQTSLFVSKK